jgi:hypothetical protein
MSQFYSQQQPGYYPPPSNPEEHYDEYEDYELEDENEGSGSSAMTFVFGCFSGGCATFIVLCFCLILPAGLWILDPGSDMFTTSYPGDDIGLTFEQPAHSDQSVVNDQGIELTIVVLNRNASSNTIEQQEGTELIIVTVQLKNLSSETFDYDDERDFKLLNQTNGFYDLIPGAVEDTLGIASLPAKDGKQGRLVFRIVAAETGLVLEWSNPDSLPRHIELE